MPEIRRSALLALAATLVAAPLSAQDTARVRSLTTRAKLDQDSITKISTSPRVDRIAARARARQDSILVAAQIVAVTPPAPPPVIPPVIPPPPAPDTTTTTTATMVGTAAVAELPRATVDVTYPAASRSVKVCPNACSLQAAIDAAAPGDELLLAPGATYPGNFTLPNKGSSTAWIVIRTDTSLVLSGTRMTPTLAASNRLARVISASATSGPVLATDLGAHHYRLTGVEIALGDAVTTFGALVRFGTDGPDQTTTTTAHHLILDRVYLHANPTTDTARCVALNSATSAVIDSWLAECHTRQGDAQAVATWNGPGPLLIQNNHLEASHEVLNFGGGTFTVLNGSPSDVTIRGNHITRPVAWKGVWPVKNLLESKHVKRMLIEGNVFENNWRDAQEGFAILLKAEDQYGDNAWTTTQDVTIRYNRIRNVGSVFNFAGKYSDSDTRPSVYSARITAHDNVIDGVAISPYSADGIQLQALNGLQDGAIFHNTVLTTGLVQKFLSMDGSQKQRLVVHSNVFINGQYGISTNVGSGATGWAASVSGGLWAKNVVIGGDCSALPAGTICSPALPATLPLGYDGRAIGADLARVTAATKDAVVAP